MASWLLSRLLYKSLDEEDPSSLVANPEVVDLSPLQPNYLHDTFDRETVRDLLENPQAMGSLEKLISESYKFIRMADDLHDVASYLNDMRICFIAITITGYVLLIIYGFVLCMRRNRQNQPPRRRNWDYQMENQRDFNNTASNNNDDQTPVRADVIAAPYMGRGHRNHTNSAPSFMRHGHSNQHQQTTRLMTEQDGTAVKHQIPHITTDPPADEKGQIPQLVRDSADS